MKPMGITILAMTILLALGWVPAYPAASQAPLAASQAYFEGPWESEPNNSYQQANGPLRSHRTYYGYPNDEKDYFSIHLYRAGADRRRPDQPHRSARTIAVVLPIDGQPGDR